MRGALVLPWGMSDGMSGSGPAPRANAQAPALVRSRELFDQGAHRDGLAQAERAAQEARAAQDPLALARALHLCAAHSWRLGQYTAALTTVREAVAQAEQLPPDECCELLCLVSIVGTEIGVREEALEAGLKALDLARQHGLKRQMTQALNRIGVCHDRAGRPEDAQAFHAQALALAREMQDQDLILSTLNSLTAVGISAYYQHSARGEQALARDAARRAIPCGQEAVERARASGDPYRLAVTSGNLGEAHGLLEHWSLAQELLEFAIETARANGYRMG